MKNQTNLETFINRFAFNKEADIEYLITGLTLTKPYIEQLKTSILKLNKSQKSYKKSLTTIKVRTDKNAKKFIESSNNLDIDFFYMVDLLKDTHHFFINMLKVEIYSKQNMNYVEMYKNFSLQKENFSELIQQIEFSREERIALNTFNRLRNIVIHAPTGIIIGYLTESVLEEFRKVVDELVEVGRVLLERNIESIKGIIEVKQNEIEKKDNLGIEDARSFAAKYNMTINELLEILRNSGHDFPIEIHRDMQLDGYAKEAILPIINEIVVRKEKERDEVKLHNDVLRITNQNSLLIVDFDYVLSLFSGDTNRTYNHIYELYNNYKINGLYIFSESKSKEVIQVINELNFTTNNKRATCNDYERMLENISNSNIIIAYVSDKIKNYLKEYSNDKYIIIRESNYNENINIENWNTIIIKKSDIVKIKFKKVS